MNVNIYKCFIASPSDTEGERLVCDKVFEKINEGLGHVYNFRIESKKWENNARPSFGEDGQSIINSQLLDDYQIFIGIMCNKFGQKTPRAGSGTEEEFNNAYERYNEKKDIEIMMYFNEELVKQSSLDLDQVTKVREFKKKVRSLGGLTWDYNGVNDFEDILEKHLFGYFVKKYGSSGVAVNEELQGERGYESAIDIMLEERLNDALNIFSNYKNVWIEPVLSLSNDISQNSDNNFKNRILIDVIIDNPESMLIKAPPQFGLTCLSHYMIKEAWKRKKVWVYLDFIKISVENINNVIGKELVKLKAASEDIDCIVLDSWSKSLPSSKKIVNALSGLYKKIPIIVMQSINDSDFKNDLDEKLSREFKVLHLLALPRNQIRKVVSMYNMERNLGDEDAVLNKVIKDLDNLNIHRTALNCLTLLKASESNFDESPINRTKMIEMVLFVLFSIDEIPTYKVKPDLKDCEYALGCFCEGLIRSGKYRFTRDKFIKELDEFCKEKLLQLEISVVFDVLFNNTIIVKIDSDFIFRSTFWIFYFAARRMYFDKNFRDYILSEKRYLSFPEIIEFYTGIDRDRSDVLEILKDDLLNVCNLVDEKSAMPDDFNPLQFAKWKPSQESIEKMQNDISEGVLSSNLPESLKDQFADNGYNQLRPYDQSIQDIFDEYCFSALIKNLKASSRALRNSDYVSSEVKRKLFKEITRGWRLVSKILFALTPRLALDGYASFEGHGFYLDPNSDFGNSFEKKFVQILQANSSNVVNMFKYDIFSHKMGPLIYDSFDSETDILIKHKLILLLISERPIGWKKCVESYISDLPKDSFYLLNTVQILQVMYRYDFATDAQLGEMGFLLKMGYAKHEFGGGGRPDLGKIKKISDSVIPKRENTSHDFE